MVHQSQFQHVYCAVMEHYNNLCCVKYTTFCMTSSPPPSLTPLFRHSQLNCALGQLFDLVLNGSKVWPRFKQVEAGSSGVRPP